MKNLSLSPSDLNTVFRLLLIAKNCGPQFLDNAESFDGMLGVGAFAMLDSDVLSVVRSKVKDL